MEPLVRWLLTYLLHSTVLLGAAWLVRLALGERRLAVQEAVLRAALVARGGEESGLTISIGSEHADPRLAPFTLVTSTYRLGPLSGVIGVMGPTRMAYDKIVALVDHTSRLVGELLE